MSSSSGSGNAAGSAACAGQAVREGRLLDPAEHMRGGRTCPRGLPTAWLCPLDDGEEESL